MLNTQIDFDAEVNTGGAALKPTTIGEKIGGRIISSEHIQATDFTTSEPLFWKNGKPKTQFVFHLQVEGEDDTRSLYIKNWGRQIDALVAAARKAGYSSLNPAFANGNYLYVTFLGEEKNAKNPRLNPTKLYEYEIVPGSNIDIEGAVTQAAQASVPVSTPTPPAQGAEHDPWATSSPATPATVTPPVQGINLPPLFAANMDDQLIQTTTNLPLEQIRQARQQWQNANNIAQQ